MWSLYESPKGFVKKKVTDRSLGAQKPRLQVKIPTLKTLNHPVPRSWTALVKESRGGRTTILINGKKGGRSLFGAIKKDVLARTLWASHEDSTGGFPENTYPRTAGIASSSKQHTSKANGALVGLAARICPSFGWGRGWNHSLCACHRMCPLHDMSLTLDLCPKSKRK